MGTGLPENWLAVHVYRWNHPCMGVCTCEDAAVCVCVCLYACICACICLEGILSTLELCTYAWHVIAGVYPPKVRACMHVCVDNYCLCVVCMYVRA